MARRVGRRAIKLPTAPYRAQYRALRKYGKQIARTAHKVAKNPKNIYKGLQLVNAARRGDVAAMGRIVKIRKLAKRAARSIARRPSRAKPVVRRQVAAISAYTAVKAASKVHRRAEKKSLADRGIAITERGLPVTSRQPLLSRYFSLHQKGLALR